MGTRQNFIRGGSSPKSNSVRKWAKSGEFVCGYWAFKISPLLFFHFSMTDFFYKRKKNKAPDTISMAK